MDLVRIGVVGAGFVAGAVHLPLLRELDARFDLAALAEPDAGRRAALADRFGIARAYADHRELLAGARLDALLICSPDATHADVVLDALDAGVHVLVEKPLCLTLEDADRIVAARDATGLTVQVGYMKRFDPAYEALAAEPLDGALLHVASTTYDPGLPRLFGGGDVAVGDPFLGALVHDVNLVHGLLGDGPPLVVLDGACTPDGRAASGVVELPGGARWTLAWMRIDAVEDFRQELALYAENGVRTLVFPAPYVLRAPTVYTRRIGSEVRVRRSFAEAYARQLEHFHACVTAGGACRTPPEQARADIELLTRIRDACRAPA